MHGHSAMSESLGSSSTDERVNQHRDRELLRREDADHQDLPDQEFPTQQEGNPYLPFGLLHQEQ